MGLLDSIDNLLGTRLGLLANDPRAAIGQMNQQAGAFNQASLLAVQAERNAMNGRPSTPEQLAAKQMVDEYTRDLAMGFAGSVSPIRKSSLDIASQNAEKMLGLPRGNTPMDRAKAMGFDMSEYHGTGVGDFPAFDPSKMKDNVQYGGSIYTTKDPAFASRVAESKWSGDYPTVMPLMIRSGKKFDMTEPISAKDAANVLRQIGQYERANVIEASGKPYRSGAEFFYFGIGQDLSNASRGSAINRGGFDVITGDPSMEIAGKAGRPQTAIFDPSRLRSRFAAFDPARVNEPDLLAAGIPFGLLAGTNIEMPKKKEKRK